MQSVDIRFMPGRSRGAQAAFVQVVLPIIYHEIRRWDGTYHRAMFFSSATCSFPYRKPVTSCMAACHDKSELDQSMLRQTMPGHDLVYATLAGDDMEDQANSIIAAMRAFGVERLVFVLSMGI
ncbi:NAD(P)H-binding protein [Janthinobacterium lividum]|nr:NAD(P)H-binding protein [Janthinobacterium lividum]